MNYVSLLARLVGDTRYFIPRSKSVYWLEWEVSPYDVRRQLEQSTTVHVSALFDIIREPAL